MSIKSKEKYSYIKFISLRKFFCRRNAALDDEYGKSYVIIYLFLSIYI